MKNNMNYVDMKLTKKQLNEIVNEVVDARPSMSIEPIINVPTSDDKPKTMVRKLVTKVSER